MTATTQISADWIQNSQTQTRVAGRDLGIDTMRGIAILMVIGIHAMPQPLDPFWGKLVDAALRPCVPIFLFASGYLTALSGRVVLWRRIKTALIPYAIAFVAAYIYMAWHNPAMDHRITTTIARFVLAYVFVYYYVFVYIGCTIYLWLIFRMADASSHQSQQRLAILLALSILIGIVAGSYIDPLLLHRGFSESFVQEVRLRDIPFWFSFVALGSACGEPQARGWRSAIAGFSSRSRRSAHTLSMARSECPGSAMRPTTIQLRSSPMPHSSPSFCSAFIHEASSWRRSDQAAVSSTSGTSS